MPGRGTRASSAKMLPRVFVAVDLCVLGGWLPSWVRISENAAISVQRFKALSRVYPRFSHPMDV